MSTQLVLTDIRTAWDQIRPGVVHVKEKTGAPWRPEDVYTACVSGEAVLYVGETGFIILQPKTNPFDGSAELLVWVAYAVGDGNIDRFQGAIDALAREHKYQKLVMWSNRPGFARVEEWTPVATVYERVL